MADKSTNKGADIKDSNVVLVEVKEVFGTKRIYPVSHNGILLLELTGKKSFSSVDISIIRSLGFTVEVVPSTIDAD
jgi:hypothetical protein